MGKIGTWLAAISWPVFSRILSALGVGTVTYIGFTAALNSALSSAKSVFGALGGHIAQFMAIAGLFEALSIIAGGMIAGLVFVITKKFTLATAGA